MGPYVLKRPKKKTKVDMGPKINLSPKQQADAIRTLKREPGMSGYDPILAMLPAGLGAIRSIRFLNQAFQPDPMPQRIKTFYDKYYGPQLSEDIYSIPDQDYPTLGDFIRMSRANWSKAKKAYVDIANSGL